MAKLNSFSSGATNFMTKPFSPQELVRKVGRILESIAARQPDGLSNGTAPA